MRTIAEQPHPSLSSIDRAILALHGLAAGVIGVVAFISANDPDFGDLQRIVIVMLVGLWGAGIVATGYVARMVRNAWGRAALLLAGPFIGILLVFGRSMLGWS